MFSLLKNKNLIIWLVIVLWIWIYFIFGWSKWNNSDFNIWAWATIWTLDNHSDNATNVDTNVNQVSNKDIVKNITNMSDKEKQDTILQKTLENNDEINKIKSLYSDESNLSKDKLKK